MYTILAFSKVEQCYQCGSAMDIDCALNPKANKFIFNCKDTPVGEGNETFSFILHQIFKKV